MVSAPGGGGRTVCWWGVLQQWGGGQHQVAVQQWGGGGATVGGRFLAAQCRYSLNDRRSGDCGGKGSERGLNDVQWWGIGGGGEMMGPMLGGGGSNSKNRPSHHKYKSPKHSLLIACLETSELKSSEHLMPAALYLFISFLRTKSQMGQTKNWSSEKSHKQDRPD